MPTTQSTEDPRSVKRGAHMSAVALGPDGPALKNPERPRVSTQADVLVQVQAAGLCRTDLYVASGELEAPAGMILGHEAAGIVCTDKPIGARSSSGLRAGTMVGIDPRIPCGTCAGCSGTLNAKPGDCHHPKQLGLDVDGLFAEFAVLPAQCLHPIDAHVSPLRAAYLEPVAAAMGALNAGLTHEDVGIIAGSGRIAELTARVLEYSGLPRPRILATESLGDSIPSGTLDFVIDAGLSSDGALAHMTGALRRGGTLVLKSRAASPRSFVPADWVAREINVAARAYGSFEHAARAVADEQLVLEDLFGAPRPLSEFEQVFASACDAENVKQFFQISRTPRVH